MTKSTDPRLANESPKKSAAVRASWQKTCRSSRKSRWKR